MPTTTDQCANHQYDRMPWFREVAAGCALALLLLALGSGQASAAIYQITIQPQSGEKPAAGNYSAFVPDGVAKVRAIIFHQHGCGGIQAIDMPYDLHWQALARKWDAILVGDDLDDNCGNWYLPDQGSKAMQERAFAYFANQSGHQEINTAPLCLWGHSGGGDWAIEYVQRYAAKVIAVYVRSGGHDPGAACNGVPILFSHAWVIPTASPPNPNDYNYDYSGYVAAGRGRGALWAWMIDPNGSHDCSNGRYVAIPFFDACMALRLPAPPLAAEAVTLKAVSFTQGWTGLSAKARIGQAGWGAVSAADAAKSTDATVSWLPSQDVAQRWSQFVTSGNGGQSMGGVSDASAPTYAPSNVTATVTGTSVALTWSAIADLQSGVRSFHIYRDDVLINTLGNWFQGHGFGDEPQPSRPTMALTDSGVAAGQHWYQIATVNGANLEGPKSARIPVQMGTTTDNAAPSVAITSPTGNVTVTTASIAVSGSASDNVGVVTVVWSNNRGGAGIANGTTAWSIAAVALATGVNTISVTAFDAANHASSASVQVTYSIGGGGGTAPSITTQPASITVTAGATATFTVAATGTPTPTCQWRRNGTNIAGATNASYTTPATTAANSGDVYTVLVSNSAGSVTSAGATLTVNSAPAITAQPQNRSVVAGQTAAFSVTAIGTATLTYQWHKGGVNIAGATAASYTTAATTTANNGEVYSVVVTNGVGSVTSSNATLTVTAAAVAPTIATQPQSQTVNAGQTATFTVVAAGTSPFTYQWRKGGNTIAGATSASYTTPATTAGNNGESYSVVVGNGAGSATSGNALLTVNGGTTAPAAGSTARKCGFSGGFAALVLLSFAVLRLRAVGRQR